MSILEEEDPVICQIKRITAHIEMKKLWAQWWIARALSGEAANRTMSVWRPLTNDEKIKDALDTSSRHIIDIEELTEIKINLMKAQMRKDGCTGPR